MTENEHAVWSSILRVCSGVYAGHRDGERKCRGTGFHDLLDDSRWCDECDNAIANNGGLNAFRFFGGKKTKHDRE